MYGPTTGDRVRLGDTGLWIQVEDDKTVYGDECKFGGGKSLRDGQGQATNKKDSESLDLIVTNALIVDWTGIYKVYLALNMLRVISGADDLRCLACRPILELRTVSSRPSAREEIRTSWTASTRT